MDTSNVPMPDFRLGRSCKECSHFILVLHDIDENGNNIWKDWCTRYSNETSKEYVCDDYKDNDG